jgi:hypothetical protein
LNEGVINNPDSKDNVCKIVLQDLRKRSC